MPARHQLAMFLAITEALQNEHSSQSAAWLCDPVFTSTELRVLAHIGLEARREDNQEERSTEEHITVLFMPHCCLELYNNALHAHWPRLRRLLIIGNSFASYQAAITERDLVARAPCLYHVRDFVIELSLRAPSRVEVCIGECNRVVGE